jgi:hypothetical protein
MLSILQDWGDNQPGWRTSPVCKNIFSPRIRKDLKRGMFNASAIFCFVKNRRPSCLLNQDFTHQFVLASVGAQMRQSQPLLDKI